MFGLRSKSKSDIEDKLMPIIKTTSFVKMQEEWTKKPLDMTAKAMFQVNEEEKIVTTDDPKMKFKLKEENMSVYDKYNKDLVVTYGIDNGDIISTLMICHLTEYKLDKTKLLSIAKNNLPSKLEDIRVNILEGIAEIAGNNYISSLIIRQDILKKLIAPLEGELYFVPLTNHNLFISKDKTKLEQTVKNINKKESEVKHFITTKSFPIKV